MRVRIVLGIIGTVLKILGLLLLVPGIVAALYHETDGIVAFALTSLLSVSAGILLKRLGEKGDVGNKEAFAAVTLGWLFATVLGSLPFVFQGLSLVDALFESVSGFSATGATILTESNSLGLLHGECYPCRSQHRNVSGGLCDPAWLEAMWRFT